MSDELYDTLRRAADLIGEENGLSEQETEDTFDALLRVADGEIA